MADIVYYISGHGYGHAARQSPIIRRLADAGLTVEVRTPAPDKFFRAAGVTRHHQRYDIGLVQPDALRIDPAATFRWYSDFLRDQPALVAREAAHISASGVRLIVADMPPIAFEIAAASGVPSVAVTHFTWDWVYRPYLAQHPQHAPIVEAITASYLKATLALRLPFAHAFDMFPQVEDVPLLANPVRRSREQVRAEMDVPPDDRLALLSMGGMAWTGDMLPLAQREGWTFLVTADAWPQIPDQTRFRQVPEGYEGYHDLIAAADVVVGKAGGSTVSECIAHRTAMIYTIRPDYTENQLLDAALRHFANSHFVKPAEFEAGAWVDVLDWIVQRDFTWPQIRTDGVAVVADRLMDFLA